MDSMSHIFSGKFLNGKHVNLESLQAMMLLNECQLIHGNTSTTLRTICSYLLGWSHLKHVFSNYFECLLITELLVEIIHTCVVSYVDKV